MTAPTTREAADHADHTGDATTMIDHAELARLAEAADQPIPPKRRAGWWGRKSRFEAAFTPAVCFALLSEIAALRGERDRLAEELHNEIMVCAGKSCDADVAERQRDELRKALELAAKRFETLRDLTDHVPHRIACSTWADEARQANQGAE